MDMVYLHTKIWNLTQVTLGVKKRQMEFVFHFNSSGGPAVKQP